jgi:hypothetical protein
VAGFDERQAEAVIAVLAESRCSTWDAAIWRDLSKPEARVKAHVSEIKADIRRAAGMRVAQAALIVALVKLL